MVIHHVTTLFKPPLPRNFTGHLGSSLGNDVTPVSTYESANPTIYTADCWYILFFDDLSSHFRISVPIFDFGYTSTRLLGAPLVRIPVKTFFFVVVHLSLVIF